jgi:hypothetical protein
MKRIQALLSSMILTSAYIAYAGAIDNPNQNEESMILLPNYASYASTNNDQKSSKKSKKWSGPKKDSRASKIKSEITSPLTAINIADYTNKNIVTALNNISTPATPDQIKSLKQSAHTIKSALEELYPNQKTKKSHDNKRKFRAVNDPSLNNQTQPVNNESITKSDSDSEQ